MILAHAGRFTWDEALLLAVPIVLIAGLLGLVRRRVRRQTPPSSA